MVGMITSKIKKDLLGLKKYRDAGIIVQLIQTCPYCGGEISAVIGGREKRKKEVKKNVGNNPKAS